MVRGCKELNTLNGSLIKLFNPFEIEIALMINRVVDFNLIQC